MTRYRITPASTVGIEARSSLHPIHGEATGVRGELDVELDGDALDLSAPARMRLECPVGELRSGNPINDRELQRRVEAGRYPSIVGEASEVTAAGRPGRYTVRGDLTFHGVTREVTGEITVTAPAADALVVEGEQTFDIRDFGVSPPRILMLRVEPAVRVRIHVAAERQAGG
jgi:polyisoprenoid-binding protein YceI